MKKRLYVALSLLALTMAVTAVPAKRGTWKTFTLSNGTEVRAKLVGDEHGHYWLADDGKAYAEKDGGFQETDRQAIDENARMRRQQVNAKRMKRLASHRIGEVGDYMGKKKGIIILVNFSVKKFQDSHDNDLFQRIANEEGFSQGRFKGSMADYFKAQSLGKFELDFDVIGPVTVSKDYSYYGANDNQGNDKYAGKMVCEAVALAKESVEDWKQYDWDDDGYVDQVYVVYAGQGEADGGASNTIWPHAYDLASAAFYNDGTGPVEVGENLLVNSYACGSELNGSGQIEGIGTMCHEFSHCLGYPDFYDIDYSGGQGMGPWDLMDMGSYNGDGYQPSGYTSYERWMAGWQEPIVLEEEDMSIENMKSLQNDGESYIIYNKGNRNEYFLLENRQLEGWDASLPSAGLLILHCDYSKSVWENNQPNDDPNHQRMTVVPADGKYQSTSGWDGTYYTDEGIATDPFPQRNVKAFNKDFKTSDNVAKKAAQFFSKNTNGTYWLDSSVEEITQNTTGNTISFKFVANYSGSNGGGGGGGGTTVDEDIIFQESFDECMGKGGNDGNWSGQIANSDFATDNEGWTAVEDKAYGANKCAKFGTGGSNPVVGSATTPAIELDGEATLTFRAGAWNSKNDGTTLNLSIVGGTIEPATVTMTKGAFTDFTATITGNGEIDITFESEKGRFFLDEVIVKKVNTTTTIKTVQSSMHNDQRIYNLNGQLVNSSQLSKGLYIVNGKLVVIK